MDRFCDHCGSAIEPGRRKDIKYCSGRCRAAAKRDRDRIDAAVARLHQNRETNELLQKFAAFAPETANRLKDFVTVYGGDCAEAALRLALSAYQEARKSAA